MTAKLFTKCFNFFWFFYRFDGMDNGNASKKTNQTCNNNNNNVKTDNIMGVVNPAVLEKWMMEEKYFILFLF